MNLQAITGIPPPQWSPSVVQMCSCISIHEEAAQKKMSVVFQQVSPLKPTVSVLGCVKRSVDVSEEGLRGRLRNSFGKSWLQGGLWFQLAAVERLQCNWGKGEKILTWCLRIVFLKRKNIWSGTVTSHCMFWQMTVERKHLLLQGRLSLQKPAWDPSALSYYHYWSICKRLILQSEAAENFSLGDPKLKFKGGQEAMTFVSCF